MLTIEFTRLNIQPGQRVLDAGCGGGWLVREAARRYPCRVVGGDAGGEGLALARRRLRRARAAGELRGPAELARLDAARLPFRDDSFDRIICTEVLEHVPDPDAAARELVRVLKPGGAIVVSVPTASSERAIVELSYALYGRGSRIYFNNPGGHVRIFSFGGLLRLLRRQGLRPYALHYRHALHSVRWALIVLGRQRWLTRQWLRFHDFGEQRESPFVNAVEHLFNWVWPKSLVVYLVKPAPRPEA